MFYSVPDAFTALATLANEQTPTEFSAEAMLAEMVRRCPSAQAWFMRASYHFDHGQYRSAIDDAWKAIDLSKESPSEESEVATAPVHESRLNAILANSLQQIGAESAKTPEVQKHLVRAVEHFSLSRQCGPERSQSSTVPHGCVSETWKAKRCHSNTGGWHSKESPSVSSAHNVD